MKRIDRIFNALGIPNNSNESEGDVDIDESLSLDEEYNDLSCEMVTVCNVKPIADTSQKVDIDFLPSDVESSKKVMACNIKPSADTSQKVDIEFLPSDVESSEIVMAYNIKPSADTSQKVDIEFLYSDVESSEMVIAYNIKPSADISQKVSIDSTLPSDEELNKLTSDKMMLCNTKPNADNSQTAEVKALLTKKTQSTEEHSDLDSPLAPLYSPLTPLVLKQKSGLHNTHREPRERNSSPLQVMSPLTLELFQTLRNDINDSIINDESPGNSDHSESLLKTNEFLDLETSGGRPKKGRKRKNTDYTLKQRKYANLPYQGKTKYVDSFIYRDYTCECQKKCHQLISSERRKQEFQKYVTLGSYEAQLLFIVNLVKETPKTRSYTIINGNKTGKKKPKQFKRTYSIDNIEVCRNMFVNTFQITPKKVDVSLKKFRSGKCIKDKRGVSVAGWNKTREEDVNFLKNVINSLPKYESHYRREQNSGSQYLKLGMTIQKIYELYVEKLKEVYGDAKSPVSFTTLRHIFCSSFNLRCKSLKKDTCSRCDAFNNKIKNYDNQEQEKIKEEREKHLKRAEDLRYNMKKDLLQAKHDENFGCITFDLEKTLPLPRIPTSIVFYKRQLWLYNCGVHLGSNDSAHCYVWIEGEAGRGAQEVGSCLIQFIKHKLHSKVQHLVLWSDCCGGQNRNIKIVLMLKAILNSHQTLKTITIKYLESGHTFLPNDTDFSKIETQLKYHERIYTAEEYIRVIKSSKKKNQIEVQRMRKEDFFSTKKIEKNIVNRKVYVNKTKVNWLQTKEILLKKENMYSIYMKMQNEEVYQDLNIEKKIKGKTLQILESDFSLLWPNGKEIPQAKLDDLKSLFEFIPKDCLDFYKSLKGNDSLQEDIEGFAGEPDFNIESQDEEI